MWVICGQWWWLFGNVRGLGVVRMHVRVGWLLCKPPLPSNHHATTHTIARTSISTAESRVAETDSVSCFQSLHR
jgi:hypothetical protein